MFTQQLRPQTFSEVVGESVNTSLLLAIAGNPYNSPSTLLFSGSHGSGKTTGARLFARALGCASLTRKDICGKCESCVSDILLSPFYVEYDSSVMGSVDAVRSLRDTFYFRSEDRCRVITIDECHLLSRQAQSAFLKVFEEAPQGVFFCLATTDVEKLLPTIRSRSLELTYSVKSVSEVYDNLCVVSRRLGLSVSDKALRVASVRSRGYMREAHMLLDKLCLLGESEFLSSEEESSNLICKFLVGCVCRDRGMLYDSIRGISRIPVSLFRLDWQSFFLSLLRESVESGVTGDSNIGKLVELLGKGLLSVYKLCTDTWVMESFSNDVRLETALLAIYQLINQGRT